MSQKQLIILALTGGFIVLIVALGFFKGGDSFWRTSMSPGESGTSPAGTDDERNGGAPIFTAEVPVNAAPTVPQVEAPVAPGSESKVKIFSISISRNGYDPSSVVVTKGDNVELQLTTVGGDYDWSLPAVGYYQAVKRGEMKRVVFDAALVGTFIFECRDYCPLSGVIRGSLTVLP